MRIIPPELAIIMLAAVIVQSVLAAWSSTSPTQALVAVIEVLSSWPIVTLILLFAMSRMNRAIPNPSGATSGPPHSALEAMVEAETDPIRRSIQSRQQRNAARWMISFINHHSSVTAWPGAVTDEITEKLSRAESDAVYWKLRYLLSVLEEPAANTLTALEIKGGRCSSQEFETVLSNVSASKTEKANIARVLTAADLISPDEHGMRITENGRAALTIAHATTWLPARAL